MKDRERLNAAPERARLAEGHTVRTAHLHSQRKSKRTPAIYRVVALTVALVIACASLLLLFGVSESGERFFGKILPPEAADKLGSWLTRLDFPFFGGVNTDTGSGGESSSADSDNFGPSDTQKPSSDTSQDDTVLTEPPTVDVDASGSIYDYDESAVPEGHVPIIPMDLSLSMYGSSYINNATGYRPNVAALLEMDLGGGGAMPLSSRTEVEVLIIHTHGTESYHPDGAISVPEGEEDARSTDTEKNVVAIGKTVADILNENGIGTVHCTLMHDSLQYKDSYARAEETIRKYLEEYPTIKLVIDIHRDSIIRSSGEIVKPVAELDGKGAAQLMCVVGSEWEGGDYPNWEKNLSLALKLRERLNQKCENICRPVYLKSHTYNQEIAPYSLLIEVGADGNSLAEAQRSAEVLGDSISELVRNI